jgi:hypothetical protein
LDKGSYIHIDIMIPACFQKQAQKVVDMKGSNGAAAELLS